MDEVTPRSQRIRWESKWNRCQQCPLHMTAKRHVLFRGTVPAEIIFLGEAPGKVENRLGLPFVGPAGTILESVIRGLQLTNYVVTNTVCCAPWEVIGEVLRDPTLEEARQCFPHIQELYKLCSPRVKLVVTLGDVAKQYLSYFINQGEITIEQKILHLRHPAYILRRGGDGSFEHKLFGYRLQQACAELGIDHKTIYEEVSYGQES